MKETIGKIRWPGPRPLSFKDGDDEALKMLVGRERDLDELLNFCQTYAVIEITAPSGVGKTSFVAAAKPRLERAGGRVVKALPWPEVMAAYKELDPELTADDDPLSFYCLALGIPICADATGLYDALRQLGGKKPLVCVFDQLEELLRYENPVATKLLKLIGRTAADTAVAHVVIARSEFRDELRPVEVRGSPTWHMLLTEIEDQETLEEIVTVPVPDGVTVEPKVVRTLVRWWECARSSRSPEDEAPLSLRQGSARPGLLHFQALLWSLRRWADREAPDVDPQRLALTDLKRFAERCGCGLEPESGTRLIAQALRSYVEHAVAGCDARAWPNGSRLMFAHAVGHLSAAGFKVPQPASALAARALQDELGPSRSRQGLPATFDLTSDTGRAAVVREFAGRFQIDGAGIAAGWEPWDVAEEMVASLEGALEQLAKENLLRHYSQSEDSVYELVHDGFASALVDWANEVLGTPLAILGGISARRGEVFDYDLSPDVFLDGKKPRPYWSSIDVGQIDGVRAAIVSGAKWLGLGVHRSNPMERDVDVSPVRFEDTIFDACSFRGTLFEGVFFRNVVFRNCLMRGVALIGCRFENVVFAQCELIGAAINKCTFDGVEFDCAGKEGRMNYVSIEDARPAASVRFVDLEGTKGLFLVKLQGGSWTFERPQVVHLSLESVSGFDFSLAAKGEGSLVKLTQDVPEDASVDIDPGIEVPTEPSTILSADAAHPDLGAGS